MSREKHPHILLVEDAVVASVAQSKVLAELGCEVTLAGTGREAIEKTQQAQAYDLILMDLGLPDVDALTVTENILESYAAHKKTVPPIIALTAYAQQGFEQECLNAGMRDFIAKPLTEEVARKLLNTLDI